MGSECSSKSETGRTVRKEGDTSEMYSNHSGSRSGKRMKSNVQKQFLQLGEYPVLYYSLKAFQDSPEITDIVLVCGKTEINYCKDRICAEVSY